MRDRIRRLLSTIETVLDGTLMILMLLMLFTVSVQVFSRYILRYGTGWSEVLSRYLFIWITMIGTAAALRRREHFAEGLLVDMLPTSLQKAIRTVNTLCALLFAGTLTYYGAVYAVSVRDFMGEGLTLSLLYVYIVVPLAALMMTIFLAERLLTD